MIRGSMILILSYKAIIKETMPAHFKYGSMTTPIIVTCWSEWQKTNKGYDCVLWRGCGGTVRRLHVFFGSPQRLAETHRNHTESSRGAPHEFFHPTSMQLRRPIERWDCWSEASVLPGQRALIASVLPDLRLPRL